jgi:hypothetical protein
LIVVDLDDTLWATRRRGRLGGAHVAGGHPIGEAFADVQRTASAAPSRILLAIAKNEEPVAPRSCGSTPRWSSAPTTRRLAHRLERHAANVAPSRELTRARRGRVIDDSPAERARVREALPEVLVPEWPEQKLLRSLSTSLRCFDATVSAEDCARGDPYAAERRDRGPWRGDVGEDRHARLIPRHRDAVGDRPETHRPAPQQDEPDDPGTRRTTETELRPGRMAARRLGCCASAIARDVTVGG